MPEGLFRKAAIDKVSSPEQLDLLMRVTSPLGWLALVTVGVMIAAACVWAVAGRIADRVDGSGTLFRGERLYDVKASMSGSIVSLGVRPGTVVAAGQVVASIKRERAETEQRDADAVTIEKNLAIGRRKQNDLAILQRQRADQARLASQGIVPRNDLSRLDREINGIQGEIDSLEAEVKQLRAQAQATTELRTPEGGRVVEVFKTTGDTIREDETLVTIEARGRAEGQICGGNVHAIVYIPASSAGRIKRGQLARVSPSDVKREEYGFILGQVEWIASHPASTADMTEKLKNDQLVRQFMAGGPVFESRVCLEPNPNRGVNPFKWSSSQGPPKTTEAGTTCFASVVVEERKPYTYVIPAARRAVGL